VIACRFLAALILPPGLCGCAVGPDFVPPDYAAPATFEVRAEALIIAEPEVEWWASLGDASLDRLIANAVTANHDLRIAASNVLLARSLLGEGRFDRWPTVTASGSVVRQEQSEATSAPGFSKAVTVWDGGFDAIWELDFFGRVRRSIEALSAEYNTAVADRRNAFVIVTAEVARNYIELRGAQYRLGVAQQNARNQEQTFQLTRALLDGGRGTKLDIARAQSQLESTLASIPPLEAAVSRTIHRLAVLTGQPPGALYDKLEAPKPLPLLPQLVAIGDPATLLRRRPDVAAAEFQLAAATARIGVAIADLFPRVIVLGSAGYTALDDSDLGTSTAERFSVGPSLSWAAFDLGRVRARVSAAEAATEASLANYERTVLLALEETENALIDFTKSRQRLERLRVSTTASETAAELARLRYRNGADSFLTVLDAERRVLELQDQLASGETNTVRNFIAVYKALGGAWQYQPE
jgi:multidrug efflux system outer membrane protein